MRDFGRPGGGVVESFCAGCGVVQIGRLYYRSCEVCRHVYLEVVIVHCTAPCTSTWHLRLLLLICPRSLGAFAGVPSNCALASFFLAQRDLLDDPDGRPCC